MTQHNRGRGRPAGSVKLPTERRQRKDYRFSPAALRQIEQGRLLAHTTATAFVEAAVGHYIDFLVGAADMREIELPHAHSLPLAEHRQAGTRAELSRQPIMRKQSGAPSAGPLRKSGTKNNVKPAATPAAPPSLRQPFYQIFARHEPGPHPSLPEGFAYDDLPKSIQPEQCPIHRVFARPCAIAVARQQVEQLKHVPGIIAIWLRDRSGRVLPRDTWQKEDGRWVRND